MAHYAVKFAKKWYVHIHFTFNSCLILYNSNLFNRHNFSTNLILTISPFQMLSTVKVASLENPGVSGKQEAVDPQCAHYLMQNTHSLITKCVQLGTREK